MIDASVDYYALLGVDIEAGAEEITKAWKGFALQHHPDRTMHRTETEQAASEAGFKSASQAYEVLRDQKRRASYDQARIVFLEAQLYKLGGLVDDCEDVQPAVDEKAGWSSLSSLGESATRMWDAGSSSAAKAAGSAVTSFSKWRQRLVALDALEQEEQAMAEELALGRRFVANMAAVRNTEARLSASGASAEPTSPHPRRDLPSEVPRPCEGGRELEIEGKSLAVVKGSPPGTGSFGSGASDGDSVSTFSASSHVTPPDSVVSLRDV